MPLLPPPTLFGKSVPKSAFYRHLELNARLKQRFVDDVASITWTAKIAPSTLNVDDGKDVHEIVVFLVVLKTEETLDDVFLTIDRQMPRHALFLLQYEERYRLLLNYKEWADRSKGIFNILKTFRTPWQTAVDIKISLEGANMDSIYEHLVGQISGFGTSCAADTKRAIELNEAICSKQRQAETLQRKVRGERNFSRQMDLNSKVRTLKQDVEHLKAQLYELTRQ